MNKSGLSEITLARYKRAPSEHTYLGIGYERAIQCAREAFLAVRDQQNTDLAETHLRQSTWIVLVMSPEPIVLPVDTEPQPTSYELASRRALEICLTADLSTPLGIVTAYQKLRTVIVAQRAIYERANPDWVYGSRSRDRRVPDFYASTRAAAERENERRS